MPTKKGFGGNPPMKSVTATKTGSGTKGFALTGKQSRKKGQFEPKTPGQRETGFTQKTPRTATAAMQGRAMPSTAPASTITRRDGRKQFKRAPGKAVF